MLKLTTQNMAPLVPYKGAYRGLGLDINAIATDTQAVAQAAQSIKTAASNTGGGHPWIAAQNNAANQMAQVVAQYVNLKNAGQLTANYIANAMTQIATISKAFAQAAASYNSADANRGASEIAQNANAIITNMQHDLSTLTVNPIASIIGTNPIAQTNYNNNPYPGITATIEPVVTNPGGTSNALLYGLAAFFLLPRLFKG